MKSLYDFIISPLKSRYNKTTKIADKDFIVNVNIENHLAVAKEAKVIAVPSAYKTKVKVGDIVRVHHNIFRRWYDVRGQEKNSRSYFKDDLYFCDPTQVYMYNNKAHLNYCFVAPIMNQDDFNVDKEHIHRGILKYGNKSLDALGIKPGALVTFTPDSEFEFIIEGEKLYCMKSNNIAIKHEYQGNEKEYNPSWTTSSKRVSESSEGTDCGHRGGCNCGPTQERGCN
jgi:hypothetical protein